MVSRGSKSADDRDGPAGLVGAEKKRALSEERRQALNRACYCLNMVRREIEIDEDTDRKLTELASEYDGDLSQALTDLVRSHQEPEAFADESEAAHEKKLRDMRDRSEADFREGRTLTWEDVKARNGL